MPIGMNKFIERALLQREVDKRVKIWLASNHGRAWCNTWAKHPDRLEAAKSAITQAEPELGAMIARLDD